jgi:Flp pilus assembly protein TadD
MKDTSRTGLWYKYFNIFIPPSYSIPMSKKQSFKKPAPAAVPARLPKRSNLLFLMAAVVTITFLSFSPALKNDFTNWDDNAYVFQNEHLAKPLSEVIPYFFKANYFIGNYIPFTMVAYALEYHVAGLKPHFYHQVNVLIHLLNVLLVFWFIFLLSGKRPWVAALVALLFGIHPMHVESVAWVSELKDLLYTGFFIAGLIFYYRYLERKPVLTTGGHPAIPDRKAFYRGYVPAFIFFIFSALSKPAALVFPLVLLLVDFYGRRRPDKWMWLEKLPFFLVSLVFGLVAIQAQQADRLLHDEYSLGQKLFFASHSFLHYIVKLFLPIRLSIFHPYPEPVGGYLPAVYYLAPFIVAALFYGVYKTLRHTRLIAFGFLFFFVNVVLVLQLISVGEAIMAERYTYVSYIGLFFILAVGVDRLLQGQLPRLTRFRPLGMILLAGFIASCIYGTYQRCKVWKNDYTIADDLLEKFPDDRLALNNKGFLLAIQKNYNDAIPLLTRATELKKDYAMAYINLMDTHLALQDFEKATGVADSALKYLPADYNVLSKKGIISSMQRQYPEAIRFFKKSLEHKKNNIRVYIYLAECYYEMKDYDAAIKVLDTALEYEPRDYILLNNKGYMLFMKKDYAKAIGFFEASLKQKPDYSVALTNLRDSRRAMSDTLQTRH